MSKRRRYGLLLGGAILIAVAGEVALQITAPPSARVVVVNEGGSTMNDVRLRLGGEVIGLPRLGPKERTSASIPFRGKRTMFLEYKMKGSPISSIEVPDFDPAELRRDGQKVMIEVQETG